MGSKFLLSIKFLQGSEFIEILSKAHFVIITN